MNLANKRLLKVMWIPDTRIIYDMRNENQLELSSDVYNKLNKYINLENWMSEYSREYHNWLNDKSDTIYDINFSVNKNMIEAIKKTNKILVDEVLYYWFDVDRTFAEDFNWELCPRTHKKLLELMNDYNSNNRLISPDEYLVFPSNLKN